MEGEETNEGMHVGICNMKVTDYNTSSSIGFMWWGYGTVVKLNRREYNFDVCVEVGPHPTIGK